MTWLRCILLAVALVTAAGGFAAADPAPAVPRKVVALYDGVKAGNARLSLVHRMAAMPLNWLGLTVYFHDLRKGLPPVWDDPDVRGVVTFFGSPGVPDPAAYLDWAGRVIDSGRRYVVLGEPGPTEDLEGNPTSPDAITAFFAKLGIRYEGAWDAVSYDAKIVAMDRGMMEFERPFAGLLPPFEMFEPQGAEARGFISVARPDLPRPSQPVIISDKGGFAAAGFTHFRDGATNFTQWYLNPFAFFERAFALGGLPRPDTTTLNGRRIYYSHIDGDGWRNVSNVAKYRRERKLSAEVMLEEFIKPYPDLPVTVAPIAADIDPDWVGSEQAERIARTIFAQPNVEAASHTYSHPFQWSFFEHYTADKERPYMSRYDASAGGVYVFDLTGDDEDVGEDKDKKAAPLTEGDRLKPGYAVPRAYANKPFDLDNEIAGSLRYIAGYAPKGHPPAMIQWSGDTSPFPAALAATKAVGATNLNGGDSRFDVDYPSVSWLAPSGRPVEDTLHIYASASNENTYTDLWTARFFGYRDVLTTIAQTERPRRLKPINVYYHVYSAEKQASVQAVHDVLDGVRGEAISPIEATAFARVGEGFFQVRLEPVGPQVWRIVRRGALQTIRFDDAAGLEVDPAAATGILGATRFQGSLYVALDPAVGAPVIALRAVTAQPPPRPMLEGSRWQISALTWNTREFSFTARGYGRGQMQWTLPAAGRYAVSVDGTAPAEIAADASGRLSLDLAPRDPRHAVRIAVTRRD